MTLPDGTRFFFDENSLGLGKALAIVRGDVVHPGHESIPEIPRGTLDPDWIPIVAEMGLIVIGRDKAIASKPVEREAFKANGLRAFWIATQKDMSNWAQLELLVRKWDIIERKIRTSGDGPWFYTIGANGVRDLPL